MKAPLVLHNGGAKHLEHMISRLDSIEDELLSFVRITPIYGAREGDDALREARAAVVLARHYPKGMRAPCKAARR